MTIATIREWLTAPAALASYIVTAVGGLLVVPPDVLLATFWETLPTLFGIASISGFTLAGTLEWLPAAELQAATLVLGLLLVGKKLGAVYSRFRSNTEGNT